MKEAIEDLIFDINKLEIDYSQCKPNEIEEHYKSISQVLTTYDLFTNQYANIYTNLYQNAQDLLKKRVKEKKKVFAIFPGLIATL